MSVLIIIVRFLQGYSFKHTERIHWIHLYHTISHIAFLAVEFSFKYVGSMNLDHVTDERR